MQVGLLNVDGFYNSLLCFIDKAVDEGFISPTARRIIVSAPTAKQLMLELEVRHFIKLKWSMFCGSRNMIPFNLLWAKQDLKIKMRVLIQLVYE